MCESSIPDLPALPATKQKQLDLQIKKIKKQLGFDTKAHLNWPGSLERRQQARAWRIRTVETYPWAADIITGKPVENQADPCAVKGLSLAMRSSADYWSQLDYRLLKNVGQCGQTGASGLIGGPWRTRMPRSTLQQRSGASERSIGK
jgi:hypothetical protein